MTSDELAELLAAVALGDQSALETLYDATCARIYGIVLRILRRPDLAADVMQDVYVRVWRSAAEFDGTTATPMTWIVAMARARAIDLVRSPAGHEEFAGGPDVIGDESAPIARQITEPLRRLLACLGELEPAQRRLLLLAYYSGWSREQLAARFETGLENVRTWLRTGLLRTRECVG
jgi:RNA polymerase sigma-70 factor, ECF subfamily